MLVTRKSEERHHTEDKVQRTWMTFDSSDKADPLKDGFGMLKILNEQILPPGGGFFLHTREDLIVITYVREGMILYKGPLETADFMEAKNFNEASITPDTKQYALNVSQSEEANVFQCGFSPDECAEPGSESDIKPSGIKKLFTHAERQGVLKLIASSDGRDASLLIKPDIQMYSTFIHTGNHLIHELKPGRSAWLHVVKGEVLVNDLPLHEGDGIGISMERSISFTAKKPSEILLFDLCEMVTDKKKETSLNKPSMAEIPSSYSSN